MPCGGTAIPVSELPSSGPLSVSALTCTSADWPSVFIRYNSMRAAEATPGPTNQKSVPGAGHCPVTSPPGLVCSTSSPCAIAPEAWTMTPPRLGAVVTPPLELPPLEPPPPGGVFTPAAFTRGAGAAEMADQLSTLGVVTVRTAAPGAALPTADSRVTTALPWPAASGAAADTTLAAVAPVEPGEGQARIADDTAAWDAWPSCVLLPSVAGWPAVPAPYTAARPATTAPTDNSRPRAPPGRRLTRHPSHLVDRVRARATVGAIARLGRAESRRHAAPPTAAAQASRLPILAAGPPGASPARPPTRARQRRRRARRPTRPQPAVATAAPRRTGAGRARARSPLARWPTMTSAAHGRAMSWAARWPATTMAAPGGAAATMAARCRATTAGTAAAAASRLRWPAHRIRRTAGIAADRFLADGLGLRPPRPDSLLPAGGGAVRRLRLASARPAAARCRRPCLRPAPGPAAADVGRRAGRVRRVGPRTGRQARRSHPVRGPLGGL